MKHYYVREEEGRLLYSLNDSEEELTKKSAIELQVWSLYGSHDKAVKFLERLEKDGYAEFVSVLIPLPA